DLVHAPHCLLLRRSRPCWAGHGRMAGGPGPHGSGRHPATNKEPSFMRVLITNDDGIDSTGLTVLAHVAADAGHEVIVAAPDVEYSGFSAGLRGEHQNGVLRTTNARPPGLRR